MSRQWPPLSIRTRLTLWYTVVLFAILLVISAPSYLMLRFALVQDLDASLATVAQLVRDTRWSATEPAGGSAPAVALGDLLGPQRVGYRARTGGPACRARTRPPLGATLVNDAR
jgi:hypothetical protein